MNSATPLPSKPQEEPRNPMTGMTAAETEAALERLIADRDRKLEAEVRHMSPTARAQFRQRVFEMATKKARQIKRALPTLKAEAQHSRWADKLWEVETLLEDLRLGQR